MPGATPNEAWPYPLPSEVLVRQSLQDLAEAQHFSLAAVNVDRLAAVQRTRGIIGNSGSNVFTNNVTSYMNFNIDHLDNWFNGGRAITSTQGPTLNKGLYICTFLGELTSFNSAVSNYQRLELEFELAGNRLTRRTLLWNEVFWRISSPIWVPANGQQLKVRVTVTGTAGQTVTVGRDNDESAPRFSWVLAATD